jgi:hypothetical protein
MRQEKHHHPLLYLSLKLSPPILHLWLDKIWYSNFDVLCTCTKVFVCFVGTRNGRGEKRWQALLRIRIGVSNMYKRQLKPRNSLLYLIPNLSPPTLHLWLGKFWYFNFDVPCTCSKVFVSFVVRRNGRVEKKWQSTLKIVRQRT